MRRGGRSRAPRTARELAAAVLERVETERAYSNLLLNQSLQKAGLSRNDGALATELVYGTLQRLNTIDYLLSPFVAKGLKALEPWVRSLLRLSFYQLYYLDRIPSHAAVNEAVDIAGRWGHKGISGMVNAVLRSALRGKDAWRLPDGLPVREEIALLHSHPEWLVGRWLEQFGEAATAAMCAANNEPPMSSVRVNRLKANKDDILAQLIEAGYDAAPSVVASGGIVVRKGGNMALTAWYEQGLFTVQDESSMLVAEALDAQPGMKVLDCCAAPGGKTTHIAELMGDDGEVHALDIHEHKAALIRAQADRLELGSIATRAGDALRLDELYGTSPLFDRILLDAPCSGFGVIRRKPDLKWFKSEEDIAAICGVQRGILRQAAPLLKPGGCLVYSTCTVEREENEAAVEQFMDEYPEFELDESLAGRIPALAGSIIRPGMIRLLPHEYGTDGFFIASLRKRKL